MKLHRIVLKNERKGPFYILLTYYVKCVIIFIVKTLTIILKGEENYGFEWTGCSYGAYPGEN